MRMRRRGFSTIDIDTTTRNRLVTLHRIPSAFWVELTFTLTLLTRMHGSIRLGYQESVESTPLVILAMERILRLRQENGKGSDLTAELINTKIRFFPKALQYTLFIILPKEIIFRATSWTLKRWLAQDGVKINCMIYCKCKVR